MQKSSFQFSNPHIERIDFRINETTLNTNSLPINMEVISENIKNPEKMLKVNGGAVLLSYFRPIIATLTMQAGVRPLNLPFVNFTK